MNEPFRQINKLYQALESDKSKIAFLLGAGCPVSIRVGSGDKNEPLILGTAGLTKTICEALADKGIEKIVKRIQLREGNPVTIEDILTHVRLLIEVVGKGKIDEFTRVNLEKIDEEICKALTKAVNRELPDIETPYHQLASWIGSTQRNKPVEIFTSNYDLLIESALESKNVPYFDGFIGSKNAFFDLHSIENEDLPSRWVKLWKLHGSINWWKDSKGYVFRVTNGVTGNKQMIYPSHLKYEQSRLMPYYAMQERLARFLAMGQSVLVICGYSFSDRHLNAIILQRLSSNPLAICFGLLHNDLQKYPEAVNCAKRTTNLCLFAKDGAISGGRQMAWNIDEQNEENNHYDYCFTSEKIDGSDDISVQCHIGDFLTLGKFLSSQIGTIHNSRDFKNAE